jgi:hypothetical protein
MTAKVEQSLKWHETTVVLREDILAQAQASGFDINDLCNRALASAAGIRYIPQRPVGVPVTAPVIIAHNGAAAAGGVIPPVNPAGGIHPVINADDPKAVITVKRVPRPPAQKAPATLPGRVSSQEKTPKAPAVPVTAPHVEKPRKPEKMPEKKGKGSAIKKFVAEVIVRDDVEESHVTKDTLYQAFARWCRERRITPVPDRRAITVTLKNQFALKEKTVNGEASWVNVHLK